MGNRGAKHTKKFIKLGGNRHHGSGGVKTKEKQTLVFQGSWCCEKARTPRPEMPIRAFRTKENTGTIYARH